MKGVALHFYDVTDIHRSQQQEYEKKERERNKAMAAIVHELRAPLNEIIGAN